MKLGIFTKLFAPFCVCFSMSAMAQLSLVTVNHHADEVKIKQSITDFYADYPIERWTYTDTIRIDQQAKVPRSHPVLTLNANAKYLSDKDLLLATYLHEQFHWHLVKNRHGSFADFVAAIKQEFPNVQAKRPYGSGSESGTLSHLITCYLEYKAVAMLLGENKARVILGSKKYYTWVYQSVLDDKNKEKLDKLVSQFKLQIL